MKYFISIALIATSFFIFSCRNNAGEDKMEKLSPETEIPRNTAADNEIADHNQNFKADSIAGPQIDGDKQEKKKQQPAAKEVIRTDWDKKIVKTATIDLEVKDYNSFYTSLREKVRSVGGYVAQEEQAQTEYKIGNNMTIKVPVDQFDNAVVQFTANSIKINERKITTQDVTTEIVDTKSRMEAKKQVRQRYMELLNQARNMNDILSVQSEINGIQEEIEAAAGQIEYLGHSSVFSTIHLTYYQVLNSAAKEDVEKSPSFGEKVKDAFSAGLNIISNLFIVFVATWPLLLASVFAYLLYKKFRRSGSANPEKLPGA